MNVTDGNSADIRQSWMDAGWKRGAFIEVKKFPLLIKELPSKLQALCESNELVYLIPILYDCALLELSFDKEPWAQAILGVGCSGDGNFKYGKNPRKLHLPIKIDENENYLEFSSLGFVQIDRELLLYEAIPSSEINWVNNSKELLLDWVADRYRQATFPDSFNKRIFSKDKLLKRLWRTDNFIHYCSGVYIKLDKDEEIEAIEIPYSVELLITIPDNCSIRKLREGGIIEKMHIDLGSIISSAKGIKILHIHFIEESEFTKKLERKFKKFSLEYYSHVVEDEGMVVPAERLVSKVKRITF
ncbi:hypothetical protein [Proteus mirabilis]|uniref:hypothetical protein n=1 Tax=Proteus mirabilis TaxID=584 RepID=UPI003214035A